MLQTAHLLVIVASAETRSRERILKGFGGLEERVSARWDVGAPTAVFDVLCERERRD